MPRLGNGRTDTVRIAEYRCLWYGSFHTQTVRVILIRDDDTDTGYGLALVTNRLRHPSRSAGHPLRLALVDRGDLPRNT